MEYTKNLNLFKYDVVKDAKSTFSVQDALNNNWDILDENLGKIPEACISKDDLLPVQTVIETYINGTSGYRIWSDGWCEQWFSVTASSNTWITSTFLKKMRDTSYIATGGCKIPDGSYPLSAAFKNYTTNTIDSGVHDDSSLNYGTWMVKIEGYLKEGTY